MPDINLANVKDIPAPFIFFASDRAAKGHWKPLPPSNASRDRDIFDISNKSPPSIEMVHEVHTSFRSWIKMAAVTFGRLHPSSGKSEADMRWVIPLLVTP